MFSNIKRVVIWKERGGRDYFECLYKARIGQEIEMEGEPFFLIIFTLTSGNYIKASNSPMYE